MLQVEKETRQISGVGFVLAVYATSRIFYLIAGFLLAKFVPTSSHQLTTTDVPPGTLNIWSYWDGEHYVALALNGYFQAPRYISPAFFPMYPLLLRSFSTVFGGPLSKEAFSYWGSLLSLLFLPFAFTSFIRSHTRDGTSELRRERSSHLPSSQRHSFSTPPTRRACFLLSPRAHCGLFEYEKICYLLVYWRASRQRQEMWRFSSLCR